MHAVFRRWLGPEYDLDALDIVLSAAAVQQLDGDPVWLLMVSGSGNAKTETVASLTGIGAIMSSSISSEGALLSGTNKRDIVPEATGGLLREIGSSGILVIKDFTSILSAHRDVRTQVIAALREVYDGRWDRNVGVGGGMKLSWTGRITVVSAVTSEYDRAHAIIGRMGDRFVLVRTDSADSRVRSAAAQQAIRNLSGEHIMRAELPEYVGGLLAVIDSERATLSDAEREGLMRAADIVTRARTAVERDSQGRVVSAYEPEMPTRFGKQLAQIMRGALSIGVPRQRAMSLALRVARDSVTPPTRLAILKDVDVHPHTTSSEAARRLSVPRTSVDRTLAELLALNLVVDIETKNSSAMFDLASDVRLSALLPLTSFVTSGGGEVRAPKVDQGTVYGSRDISGRPMPRSGSGDIPGHAVAEAGR